MTEDVASLPWQDLKHTEGEIPWPLLERFADALAADDTVLPRLQEVFGAFMVEPYERPSYECLYVPAIIGMAAPRLSDAVRRKAAEFLVTELVDAGQQDDDVLVEMLEVACGALGPPILPVVLDAMPPTFRPWEVTLNLWSLAAMAAKSNDAAVRQRTIDLCLKALRRAEQGRIDITDVDSAALVLASMQHREARPLIQRLYEQTECADLNDALELMDGPWKPDFPLFSWEEPIRKALTENWEALRTWYAERDASPAIGDLEDDEDAPDDEEEAEERRAVELANRFADSEAAARLPENLREDAPFIAESVLRYAWSHVGVRPEELREGALHEVLTDVLPRKISADKELFKKVAPVTAAFLAWLEAEGIVKNAATLAAAVNRWSDEIVSNAMDRSRWGPAKQFVMRAQAEGVDLGDAAGMQRFQTDYSLRILQRLDREADTAAQGPLRGTAGGQSAKVGRNEPCPCGSGKKYKKCCGRH